MNNDAAGQGPVLSDGLGLAPERAAFERWLNPGQHAGNVSPWVEPGRYEKDTHNLAWLAWRAAVAAERERCARLCEGMHQEDGPHAYAWTIRTEWAADSEGPNVRGKLAPTAGRRAQATENVHRTCGLGLVACRWCSA